MHGAGDATITAGSADWVIDGERVTMPVEVRSAKMVAATFLVDPAAAQRVIDYSGLGIAREPGGKAVCSLSAVQYLDNDLGPYNEIAVAFVVRPHDLPADAKPPSFLTGKVATFIHRLPVNQQFTCQAGRGIWGFPKWVTDITYNDHGRHTDAVLLDDDQFVLALVARRGFIPLPSRHTEMSCYSWCDGVLRRTPWTTRNRYATAMPGGAQLELGTRHPMAIELRSLGLPKRAVMTMTTGIMQASFGPPEIVG
ncbi:MAG: acetoacetate decarboxylase family protein [Acidimicrobiales bacterium]|nr:acetoacetate decarboxylase family protein [Acidimicrobiales bacterium]